MSKTILVIDDATSVRMSVAMSLQEEGYDILEAVNGEDALSRLDGRNIDMMICDVNMPKMDGITFLRTIKNDKAYSSYKFTPIIMLTTEAGDDKKEEGKKAGAKAWLVKPFKPDKLIESVKKLVG